MNSAVSASSKCGIARRIAAANVVHRINDSFAEEITPRAVGHRLGEERVLLRRQPIDKRIAAIFVAFDFALVAERNFGRDDHVGLEMLHFAAVEIAINNFFARAARPS